MQALGGVCGEQWGGGEKAGRGGKRARRKRIGEVVSEQQSYEPQFNEARKMGLELGKDRVTRGGWSLEESRSYLRFMEDHRQSFLCERNRRMRKVFNQLSKVLRKRTPDQCRSHHQKLQQRCNDNLEQIIAYVRSRIRAKEADQSRTGAAAATGTREEEESEEEGLLICLDGFACW